MKARLSTGGEHVAIRCELPWLSDRLVEAADGCLSPQAAAQPSMSLTVERSTAPFDIQGWARLSRDAWSRPGEVVVRDVVTSGFDLHLAWRDGAPEARFRWRPPRQTRTAAHLLRTRARLLMRAALLHYPVLWVAATRGRAPVHAALVTAGTDGPALLVGPSGVGKTTLVQNEVAAGGVAASDNLCVGDGDRLWGLVEPVRGELGTGRATSYGRREGPLLRRAEWLRPRTLVLLQRGTSATVRTCDHGLAARALVASTYAAGELRRYWQLHALLALGTGVGPAHPPVAEVAAGCASRLTCQVVELPRVHGVRLGEVLAGRGVTAWT